MSVNSKKKQKLYLLTGSYPYSYSAEDNFLENEIPFLSDRFDLTLVPLRALGTRNDSLSHLYQVDLWLANYNTNNIGNYLYKTSRLLKFEFISELFLSGRKIFNASYFWTVVSNWLQVLSARSWIDSLDVDTVEESIFYTWWFLPETLGLVSASNSALPRVVTRAHGFDLYEDRSFPEGKPFRSRHINLVEAIYPDSEGGSEYLRKKYPAVTSKIKTIYMGVPDVGLNCCPSEVDEIHLFSCSILDPVKRLDLLLEGIQQFAFEHPEKNIRWTHYGTGSLSNYLNSMIKNKHLDNLMCQIYDYPGIEKLREFYLTEPLDCFLNMSSSEGVPIAMMEASSFGIPLIGPSVGGVPEIVFHQFNGYLLGANPKPIEISSAIADVAVVKKGNLDYRNASRKVWSENFDSNNNYRNFVALLLDSSQ